VVLGYLFGLFVFALLQTLIIFFFTIYVLNVTYRGDLWQILVFQLVVIMGSVNLGIFTSTFARNEFQVIQFIPIIILPQVFLGGILWPVEQMQKYLQYISDVLPLTYAVRGLRDIMINGKGLLDVGVDLGVLVAFTILTSVLAAMTLKRGVN
jgi:ABC-2 type transport system permease protein